MTLNRTEGIPTPGYDEALDKIKIINSTLEAKVDTLLTKIDTLDSVLDAIKDTTGIKKITDALPVGNNNIGKISIDQTTPGTTNKVVAELSGSKMELYGATVAARPAATSLAAGTTFTIVDDTQDFKTWMSNGVNWGEEI